MDKRENVAIADLHLTGRATRALARGGIRTLDQLVEHDAWDLTDIRGFGTECLRETVDALAKRGLTLMPSDYKPRS